MATSKQGSQQGAGGGLCRGLWRSEDGATTTEYALMVGLIVATLVVGGAALGAWLNSGLETAGSCGQVQPASGTTATGGKTAADSSDDNNSLKWRSSNGAWKAVGDKLSSDDPFALAITDAGANNYKYSLTMQTTAAGNSSPGDVTRAVFRYQDANNYYALVPKTNGTLELGRMQDGQWQPWLAYATTKLDPTVAHRYDITATGARLEVAVDGVRYLDYQSRAAVKGTGVGVVNSSATGVISNVQITPK